VVNKQVGPAVVGGDKAVSFLTIEPFHCS
jgi:hypothetical protein